MENKTESELEKRIRFIRECGIEISPAMEVIIKKETEFAFNAGREGGVREAKDLVFDVIYKQIAKSKETIEDEGVDFQEEYVIQICTRIETLIREALKSNLEGSKENE